MNSGVEKRERFYGWISLGATALAGCIACYGLMYSFGAFQPSLCKWYGASADVTRNVSLAYMLMMVFMSLSAPLAGGFVGKFGARRAIVVGNIAAALGLILLAFHTRFWQLYVAYGLLIGIGATGFGGMIAQTTIANNWFRRRVPLAIGVITAAGGAGGLIMAPVSMGLINAFGWRNAYLGLCAIVVVFAVIIPGIIIRNKPEDMGQLPEGGDVSSSGDGLEGMMPKSNQYMTPVDFTIGEATRTSAIWLLVIVLTMTFLVMTMLMAHQIAFLEGIGISSAMASLLQGLMPGISAAANILMGLLTLKFSLKKLSVLSYVFILAGMVLVVFTRSLPMAFAYTVTFGIGYGLAFVATMSLSSAYFGRTDYPKIIGVTFVFSIFGGAGAPLVGALYDSTKNYNTAFIVGVVAAAIGLLCMMLMKAPVHPSLKKAKS